MKRDFNSAFPEQKMEPEVNLLFEPERSESESDSDSDKDPSAPKGIWSCEDPTGCLPYEKLDLENWTNSELFQLGCEGLAVYNAAHNTNYQIKYIMRTVEIARTVNDPKEDARYVITLGVEDDKTGNVAGDFHYNWVGEIPSLGDQNTNEGIGPMKRNQNLTRLMMRKIALVLLLLLLRRRRRRLHHLARRDYTNFYMTILVFPHFKNNMIFL